MSIGLSGNLQQWCENQQLAKGMIWSMGLVGMEITELKELALWLASQR